MRALINLQIRAAVSSLSIAVDLLMLLARRIGSHWRRQCTRFEIKQKGLVWMDMHGVPNQSWSVDSHLQV